MKICDKCKIKKHCVGAGLMGRCNCWCAGVDDEANKSGYTFYDREPSWGQSE